MTALFDVIARSSLILVAGLAVMPMLRQRSAALRHWVLFTSLIAAAAVPVARWLVPTWDAVDVAHLLPPPVAEQVAVMSESIAGVTPKAGMAGPSPHTASTPLSWTTLVTPVWGAGAALSLAMLLVGITRLHRVHAAATPVEQGPWRDSALAEVRVTARPGLLLVWGVRRPTIIVPARALDWNSDRVRSVLHHELAHVSRHDWLLLIAAETVRALYWFNPLVWIACARLRAEAELACDDAVITSGTAGSAYASHVVEIARELTTRHWLPAPAIVRQSTLERRVRAMLDKNRNRTPLSSRARNGALAMMCVAVCSVAAIGAQTFVSLSGTIVDPSQGVLPGVKLILVNEQTQAKYEIQTDRSGRYEFVGLPPGNYTIDAALPGFSRFAARVSVGTQNLQQDLTMSVGTIQETITVRQDGVPPPPDPERERRIEAYKQKRAQEHVARAAAPDAGAGTVRMGGNIRVPLKLRDFRPTYPHALRGTEGVVVLHARIGTSGSVEDIEVASSTHAEFAQSAIDAVRQWEFDATLLNGEPIATPMQVTVNFKTK